ncbi:MAG TPA: hypothetical protein VF491_17595 [Vicinamibacterales bacterium]
MPEAFKATDVGKPWKCWRCGKEHPILQPHADSSTAAKSHLYVECRGSMFFIGQVVEGGKR